MISTRELLPEEKKKLIIELEIFFAGDELIYKSKTKEDIKRNKQIGIALEKLTLVQQQILYLRHAKKLKWDCIPMRLNPSISLRQCFRDYQRALCMMNVWINGR